MSLDTMLEHVPSMSAAESGAYNTIDAYTEGTVPLYGSNVFDKPIIHDMPSVGGQVHLHENELGISGGRLYPYDRSAHRLINSYEGAMLDHYAKVLDIDKK